VDRSLLKNPIGIIACHGPLLFSAAGCFVLIRLGEAGGFLPGWARSFGDDLLCMPLVLSLALAVHRLAGRPATYTLPVSHGLTAVAVFGLFFEGLWPRWHPAAVADPWDLAMYLAGFLVFQFGLNRPGRGEPAAHVTLFPESVADAADRADLLLTSFSSHPNRPCPRRSHGHL